MESITNEVPKLTGGLPCQTTDYKLCVVCQKEAEPLVLHPRLTSYHNLLEAVKEHPPAELLWHRGPCHRLCQWCTLLQLSTPFTDVPASSLLAELTTRVPILEVGAGHQPRSAACLLTLRSCSQPNLEFGLTFHHSSWKELRRQPIKVV